MCLLSRFSAVRTVGSRRSKKQSRSTRLGLRVDTDLVEFRQLQEVGIFSYLCYSLAKSHVNGWGCSKRLGLSVFSVLKHLNRDEKISIVVAVNSVNLKVSLFM